MKNKTGLAVYLGLAVILSSCAHQRVVAWANDKMEVCGNGWSTMDSMKKEAEQSSCHAPRAIGGRVASNLVTYGTNARFGMRQSNCITFQCN